MAEGSSSMEHHSGDLVEKMEQEEINDFAEFKANITRGRPQATGEEFSIGPVAARDIARRSPSLPEVNSLATEQTQVEYHTALPSSASEEFVSVQPAGEAKFGEGSVQTSSSAVDVLEISTSEEEQADVMDGEESSNQSCSDNKENYPHLEAIQAGAISFNLPMAISPAHKLSRRFGGTGDFRLREYEQKLCSSARTATLPHVKLPHGSRGSASPSVGLLDISSESRSETFAADSYSVSHVCLFLGFSVSTSITVPNFSFSITIKLQAHSLQLELDLKAQQYVGDYKSQCSVGAVLFFRT